MEAYFTNFIQDLTMKDFSKDLGPFGKFVSQHPTMGRLVGVPVSIGFSMLNFLSTPIALIENIVVALFNFIGKLYSEYNYTKNLNKKDLQQIEDLRQKVVYYQTSLDCNKNAFEGIGIYMFGLFGIIGIIFYNLRYAEIARDA